MNLLNERCSHESRQNLHTNLSSLPNYCNTRKNNLVKFSMPHLWMHEQKLLLNQGKDVLSAVLIINKATVSIVEYTQTQCLTKITTFSQTFCNHVFLTTPRPSCPASGCVCSLTQHHWLPTRCPMSSPLAGQAEETPLLTY